MKKQQICILGSTGSIGVQALDVIRQHPDLYEVYCLTANNSVDKLAEQAREFNPAAVVIANTAHYDKLVSLLADRPDIKVYAGTEALNEIVEAQPIDAVLASMVGFSGLVPTIRAIKARKKICLANKETLVVAGELILKLVEQYHVDLLPVDSEHSAIFQCLVGEDINRVDKLLLTCSGGPFRQYTYEQLQQVTAKDALKHPTWRMGAKITIDSASLMNKGFEVMEARWLFGIPAERIEVLIHPQSVVHSGVQFIDGAVKAQLGVPDMRLPIQYAFSYPQRLNLDGDRLDLFKTQHLDFIEPDVNKFRCLGLAYEAIRQGGNMPCILNAANEVVNLAFREGRCTFTGMADVIEKTMQQASFDSNITLDTYLQTDTEARRIAQSLLS
ncbi:MAG: 1-deoxy-D-xylulose-5-phosphate reductoisomerase [Prevotellaceae bacterium]|nr:1-deoxy-D-xylulose-5-phosphate reductoisomerase [Prevotellaceae bacterium]MBF1061355.1 1-deoxy-D-xylulose-5-phosphate reductoisomerase [Prevotellaceae bacterium]MBF1078762.1 1-deoxy-D-xylulose-5-phosphate reductoisomerase [Prevotellaceae bacterium]